MPDFLPRRIRIVIKIKIMNNKAWTAAETGKLITLVAQKTPEKEIAKLLNRGRASIRGKINALSTAPEIADTKPVTETVESALAHKVHLDPPVFGRLPLFVINSGDWIRFGLVADTHLACQEERLDALHSHYDLMESEGITTVLHAGNFIDGYLQRINGDSVYESTPDGQADYFVKNYPARNGLTTYYISGDDHDGVWFAKGFNMGRYTQCVAEEAGRTDLKYIGHVEADIELKTGAKKPTMIRVAHPGGGCPYARSYVAQKVAESYEGGEKPAILILGHHHVLNYTIERNIHVVNMPGFQAQTVFARKKRLRMEVGGCIMEFKVRPDDGAVTRLRLEANMFYDRAYYRRYLKSDSSLVKGHLVLNR
jgi:predicted phosphodiesterase